jgi:hypothetical protein
MGSDSGYETIQLPHTEYDTELDRFGDVLTFLSIRPVFRFANF